MNVAQIAVQIPKVRTPLQLAGLVFTVLAASLIYRVDPGNIQVISLVAAFGVAVLAIPLTFDSAFIREIPTRQRAWFLLTLLALQLASFGVLAFVSYELWRPDPKAARFDSRFEGLDFFERPGKKFRAEVRLHLSPLSNNPNENAAVFTGIVTIHDEAKIILAGLSKVTWRSCAENPSCIGYHVFREFSQSPLLVRGGSPSQLLTATVDVKDRPQVVRVWWEFYQREGSGGAVCRVDADRVPLQEGIPPLAMFRNGTRVADFCYRSYGQKTLQSDRSTIGGS